MGKVKPKEVAELIIDSFDIESCEKVDTCIERQLQVLHPSLNEAQVFETAYEIKERVKDYIDRYIEEYVSRGLLLLIRWSDSDPDRLIGCSFIYRDDPPEIIVVKRRLKLMPVIWDAIHRLTPIDFEKFCCKFLAEKGFSNLEITQHTRDGGIDFHGETQHGMQPFLFSITVIGQARRYDKTNSITESQVRDLWGAAHDISLSGVQTLAVFITTSQFTPDALKFAKRNGILTSEGQQIALFITESGIGITENDKGSLSFSKGELLNWISDPTE